MHKDDETYLESHDPYDSTPTEPHMKERHPLLRPLVYAPAALHFVSLWLRFSLSSFLHHSSMGLLVRLCNLWTPFPMCNNVCARVCAVSDEDARVTQRVQLHQAAPAEALDENEQILRTRIAKSGTPPLGAFEGGASVLSYEVPAQQEPKKDGGRCMQVHSKSLINGAFFFFSK